MSVLYARAAAGLVFPVLVDVVVPALIVRGGTGHVDLGPIRLLGLPFVVAGAWLLLDSVFVRFAREGRGTLVPIDPPRFVVQGGAYRIVRNPMYVANVAIITGSALVFESWPLVVWAAAVFVLFNTFVVFYEEPALHRLFGNDYDRYREYVGRWLPHRTGRHPPTGG